MISHDIRYAVHGLSRNPGFTAVAVLTLTLGIAFNTTLFAVVDALLLRPLAVAHPEQLVNIYTSLPNGEPFQTTSYLDYRDLTSRNDTLTDVLAFSPAFAAVRIGERSRFALGEVVTGNYFEMLGVTASVGRLLAPTDDRRGASRVVAISTGMWRSEFASDRAIGGRVIRIHGQPYSIVGVVPDSFKGLFPMLQPEVWTPMAWAEEVGQAGISNSAPSPGTTALERRGYRWLFLTGRLGNGQTPARAEANLQQVMTSLAREYPQSNRDRRISVVRSSDARILPQADRTLRGVALALLAAAGLVLLIACANVTGMLLSRALGRQREIGIRLALGARRWQLVRQLLVEGVLISSAGALGGIAVAMVALRLITAVKVPIPIPLVLDLALDTRLVTFTLLIAITAGVGASLLPALRSTRTNLVNETRAVMATITVRGSRWTVRDVLVAGQIALTLLLLIVAGLQLRSLKAAERVDVGFKPGGVAAAVVDPGLVGYDRDRKDAFYAQAVERIRSIGGVQAVSLARRIPLYPDFSRDLILIEGLHRADDKGVPIDGASVDAEYFDVLGVPLVAGRNFNSGDTSQSPRVAIISKAMAARFWPRGNAIGSRFHVRAWDAPAVEVVGVTADYNVRTVKEDPADYIHYPVTQRSDVHTIVARGVMDAATLGAAMRREIAKIDPDVVVLDTPTMAEQTTVSLMPSRLISLLAAIVGFASMLLAAVGLYGLLSYAIECRTREIGIRMALGATRPDVIGVVLRQASVLMGVGIAGGAVLALLAARVMSNWLYKTPAVDPAAWISAMALLLLAALVAHVVPVWRATRIHPSQALRYE